jgi:hypothetical protein
MGRQSDGEVARTKLDEAGDLVRPESRIHELPVSGETGSITLGETVSDATGEKRRGIDSRSWTVDIAHGAAWQVI